MSIASEILAQALNLPPQERAEIADELLQSLPEEDDTLIVIDEEYEQELLRRLEDIRLGRAKTIVKDPAKHNRCRRARAPRP